MLSILTIACCYCEQDQRPSLLVSGVIPKSAGRHIGEDRDWIARVTLRRRFLEGV
jgi:hypothetical protein